MAILGKGGKYGERGRLNVAESLLMHPVLKIIIGYSLPLSTLNESKPKR